MSSIESLDDLPMRDYRAELFDYPPQEIQMDAVNTLLVQMGFMTQRDEQGGGRIRLILKDAELGDSTYEDVDPYYYDLVVTADPQLQASLTYHVMTNDEDPMAFQSKMASIFVMPFLDGLVPPEDESDQIMRDILCEEDTPVSDGPNFSISLDADTGTLRVALKPAQFGEYALVGKDQVVGLVFFPPLEGESVGVVGFLTLPEDYKVG
jgi:hypothetical protein